MLRRWRTGTARAARSTTWLIRRGDGSLVGGRGGHSGTPLFFPTAGTRDALAVGANLRDVVAHADGSVRADAAGIRDYLAFGFVPAPRTPVQGWAALPPGSVAELSVQPARVHDFPPTEALTGTPTTSRDFEKRLVTQVEHAPATALLLSGGIDSALVAALAQRSG